MGTTALALFVAYLSAMIGIGLWAARRAKQGEEDYFLGGRGFSAFSVALSAVSSGRSAWLVIGASALAWRLGLSAFWLFPGYIVAEAFLLAVVGRRLRVRSGELSAITIPEVLARSVKGAGGPMGSRPVQVVAALVIVLFLITYVSAQLVAGGKALETLLDVDGETWGLCITAGIVLVYTFLGGYRAVVITDVLQALFMIFGLVVLPLLGVVHVGGLGALFERLREVDPALLAWSRGALPLIGGLAIGLGSLGNPPILLRTMSIQRPEDLRRAAVIGTTWNVVMAAGAMGIGLVGRALYPEAGAFPGQDVEQLYVQLGHLLSTEYLFAGFVGVLLAALFAAIMSTCDSQLLVVASSLSRDLRGAKDGEAGGLAAGRLAVFVSLVAAVAISFGAQRIVGDFVLFSWAALGAAFGPTLLLALYGSRVTARGLVAGMLAGAVTVVVWGKIERLDSLLYELIPGFLVALVVTWTLRESSRPDL